MRAWLWLALLAACSKDEGAPATTTSATAKPTDDKPADKPLSPARAAVVEAWKQAGLAPTLAAGEGFGKDCSVGTVERLDVVICEYGNAAEAKQAEQPGLAWVGATTGTSWAAGSLVIAVADRKKADPHGKTINQLMKSAPK